MVRLQRWWPIVALTFAAAWLHHPLLMGRHAFFRDTTFLYEPAKFYLAKLLRAGVLPQWWPWDGSGAPMLAQPIFSVFHPTTLFYLVLPFWKAFAAQDIAGTFYGLCGTYLLARSLKQSRHAAFVAACVFASNGYVSGLVEHQFMKLSEATMPWYWWGLVEAHRRGGRWLLAPPIAMGMLLLAGDPQVAILTTLGGGVLLLAIRASWRNAVMCSVAPFVGATLAAVQLVPALLLAPETERSTTLIRQNDGPLDLMHIVSLVVPMDAGGFARSLIVGLSALALIGASLVSVRRRRVVVALWMLVGISAWLSLGAGYGLNALAGHVVPLWGKFRYPIKSWALACLAGGLLAGDGLALLGNRKRGRMALAAAGAFALLMLSSVLVAHLTGLPVEGGENFLLASALPALIVLPAARRGLRLTATVIAAAQLLWFGARVLPTADASLNDEPPIARVLRANGVGLKGPAYERFDLENYPSIETPMHVAAGAGGWNSSYGAFFGIPTLTFYTPGTSARLEAMVRGSFNTRDYGRLLGIYGIGYLAVSPKAATPADLAALGAGDEIPIQSTYGDKLYPLKRTLGRAYAVHRARPSKDVIEARKEILSSSFKPGREILIETDQPLAASSRPDEFSIPATVKARTNTTVTIGSESPWPGYLVLNESWYPGWTATVDGQSTPVLIANGYVKAVELPAGPHEVVFRYQTPGLVVGFTVSFLGWIVVGLLFLRLRNARRALQ